LKFTFFDFITFRKIRDVTVFPPHGNLVPEIKGFLGFRKGKRSLTLSVPQIYHVDRGYPSLVHICLQYFLLVFWGRVLHFPTKLGEHARYAPVLCGIAFLEGSLVDLRLGPNPA